MTDHKSVNDKVEALGTGVTDTVHDLIREAKPLLHHAADQVSDYVSEMTQQGVDAACKGKREIEKSGQDLLSHVSHMIRHEPFKAVMVAAGIGAATALFFGLITRSHPDHRPHTS